MRYPENATSRNEFTAIPEGQRGGPGQEIHRDTQEPDSERDNSVGDIKTAAQLVDHISCSRRYRGFIVLIDGIPIEAFQKTII